jgi:hypothetical protein
MAGAYLDPGRYRLRVHVTVAEWIAIVVFAAILLLGW